MIGGNAGKGGPSLQTAQTALGEIIDAIGEPRFPVIVAQALQRLTRFDLAALVVHRGAQGSEVVFDDFDRVGCRIGIETYARTTHRINPMLGSLQHGPVRARDFARGREPIERSLQAHVFAAPEEELGYRTVGWPKRQEEIGLYFDGLGGVVELGLYRERARTAASQQVLGTLRSIRMPLIAAFGRHRRYVSSVPSGGWAKLLSRREKQVCDLLLEGYASDAVAAHLGITRNTVKDHRKNIFRKLQISSLAELFARAR